MVYVFTGTPVEFEDFVTSRPEFTEAVRITRAGPLDIKASVYVMFAGTYWEHPNYHAVRFMCRARGHSVRSVDGVIEKVSKKHA